MRWSSQWMPLPVMRLRRPSMRLSATVMPANRPLPCGTYPMPRRAISAEAKPAVSSPESRIAPAAGGAMPITVLSSVDLPAPLLVVDHVERYGVEDVALAVKGIDVIDDQQR